MKEEIWKDIKGYEGDYKVSNYGRIKSFKKNKEVILKQVIKNGYCYVCLTKNKKSKTFRVHRLVAETFILNYNNYPCVNHINEIKTDNNVDNLEWCTYEYNNNYGKKKQEIYQMSLNKDIIKKWGSITKASDELKISKSSISDCLNYNKKSAGGFIWRRVIEKEEKPLFEINWDFVVGKNESRQYE